MSTVRANIDIKSSDILESAACVAGSIKNGSFSIGMGLAGIGVGVGIGLIAVGAGLVFGSRGGVHLAAKRDMINNARRRSRFRSRSFSNRETDAYNRSQSADPDFNPIL